MNKTLWSNFEHSPPSVLRLRLASSTPAVYIKAGGVMVAVSPESELGTRLLAQAVNKEELPHCIYKLHGKRQSVCRCCRHIAKDLRHEFCLPPRGDLRAEAHSDEPTHAFTSSKIDYQVVELM